MQPCKVRIGLVAKSTSGHDGGRYYAVVALDGPFAVIADGKVRKLEKPKKKNARHLTPTGTVLTHEQLSTNRQLRRALFAFNNGGPALAAGSCEGE